jgi:hypothetical protein
MNKPDISILLPTLGRAEKLPGLAANIADTTQGHDWQLVFALDRADIASWEKLQDALMYVSTRGQIIAVACDGTYPVKTNAAYRASSGSLVLPTADDVVFREGWLEPVIERFQEVSVDGTAEWFTYHVVGTNDLSPMSNPRHATMPVIRRAYIETLGCSWGEPGLVFHEGYRHNFVETEICKLADQRGVWVYEPSSVIEHLHPAWGKREEDDTDEKGNKAGFEADHRLHEERLSEWN